ncbi:MAG: TolC family protein [Myxococcales bacterium]
MRSRWVLLWLVCLPSAARADDRDTAAEAQELVVPPEDKPAGRTIGLKEAMDAARANHPQVRQAKAQTEYAEGTVEVSRAPLLPQLSGNASYVRTTSNFVFRPSNNPNSLGQLANNPAAFKRTNQLFNFYNFGITLTQQLYDFGNSIDSYRASKELVRAQNANEQSVLLSVEYNVRNAYFTARASRADVAVARQTVRNQERHRDQIQAFVEAETRPEIDLAQVKADLANARVQLIQAQNAYDVARATLNQAMGVEGSIDYEVADETLPPIREEESAAIDLLKLASERRPELRALAYQASAQQLTERATKGRYGPVINAQANFTDAGKDIDNLTWNWNVGANLTWTPWAGGIIRGQLKQVRANMADIQAQVDILRQQVLVQLEQARLAVRAGKAVLAASEEVLENATLRYGYADGRYREGVGEVIELEDAQVALTTAQAQKVQAEYDLAIARAQLLNALGRP